MEIPTTTLKVNPREYRLLHEAVESSQRFCQTQAGNTDLTSADRHAARAKAVEYDALLKSLT